jgi:hypothetical protein
MRTPAEQAIHDAERPIYEASAALDKLLSQMSAVRSGLARLSLPIDPAARALDHSDDLAGILISQMHAAAAIINDRIERFQLDEDVRFVRDHGLFALAANDNTTGPGDTPAPLALTVDETLTRLVAGLRGGAL